MKNDPRGSFFVAFFKILKKAKGDLTKSLYCVRVYVNSNRLEKGDFEMETPKVFESEYRFCLILWENEPVKSSKLVELCKEQLGWKPTTTYTVIKRLSERGVLKNENTVVTSLVTKDQVQASELNEMVEKTFEGSLPAFIAAFTKHQKISEAEIDAVQEMIDRFRNGAEK
jgi:predicted transcriptional regulator